MRNMGSQTLSDLPVCSIGEGHAELDYSAHERQHSVTATRYLDHVYRKTDRDQRRILISSVRGLDVPHMFIVVRTCSEAVVCFMNDLGWLC